MKRSGLQVGAPIPGNYDCRTDHWMEECCFCKPNGVRSTQLAVWVPDSRGAQGRRRLSDIKGSVKQLPFVILWIHYTVDPIVQCCLITLMCQTTQ